MSAQEHITRAEELLAEADAQPASGPSMALSLARLAEVHLLAARTITEAEAHELNRQARLDMKSQLALTSDLMNRVMPPREEP